MAFSFKELLYVVPIFLISLTVHEFAHSFAAYLLGDETSKEMGRFSLNPLRHIDPIGFFLFIIAGFGWAKPVMINRRNLKNPMRDDVLIALAGPISNIILACFSGLIIRLMISGGQLSEFMYTVANLLFFVIIVNVSLAVFNMLPIPPLDGSHIVTNLIERKNPELAYKFYMYGSRAILLIIVAERITNLDLLPISAAINYVVDLISTIVIGLPA